MGNIATITTRKKITPEMINVEINRIIKERFKNLLKVTMTRYSNLPEKDSYGDWEWWVNWEFSKMDGNIAFNFAILSYHKMSYKHAHGDWNWWAQMTLSKELAFKYNGTHSDEGIPEKWKETSNTMKEYRHYRDWVGAQCGKIKKGDPIMWNNIVAQIMSGEDKKLREL